MGNMKQKAGTRRRKKQLQRHKRSVLTVISALLLLVGVVSVNSVSLQTKNEAYKEQTAELKRLIAEEDRKAEDIAEYEKYVKTDEYVEYIAKEKLGLAHSNEILFKAEK